MNSVDPPLDRIRLQLLRNQIQAARPGFQTGAELSAIREFLEQVRDCLRMDVAFVSRFTQSRRVFEIATLSSRSHAPLAVGGSDDLLDTYCKLVASGELPAVVQDALAYPELSALPITHALGIRAYLSARVQLPGGDVVGTVCCFSHDAHPELRSEDAAVLQAIADAISASIRSNGEVRGPIWPHWPR